MQQLTQLHDGFDPLAMGISLPGCYNPGCRNLGTLAEHSLETKLCASCKEARWGPHLVWQRACLLPMQGHVALACAPHWQRASW
jgi:hypothetical protein